MGIFSHSRHRIFSQAQHPFTHNIEDIVYSHPSVTGSVTTLAQAMNHLFAVLYPTAKEAVATKDDLPLTGNSIGDMRVVVNDHDNKSASYRFELREGDLPPGKWYKIYDLDFSSDSILASWQNVTQDQYVQKRGRDDTDSNGIPVAGVLAGQSVYGGTSPNTSLNLFANSGDGLGPPTGYVQFGDNVRPIGDNQFHLGDDANRFKKIHSVEAKIGTITLLDNVVTSSSGILDLSANDLTTNGYINASHIMAIEDPSHFASGSLVGDISIGDGYIQSASGIISIGSNDLISSGLITVGDLTLGSNQIESDTGVIDFGLCDLVSVNSVEASLGVFESIEVGLGASKLTVGSDGNFTKGNGLTLSVPLLTISGITEIWSELSVSGALDVVESIKSNTSLVATDANEASYVAIQGGDFGNQITSIGQPLNIVAPLGLVVTGPFIKPGMSGAALGSNIAPFGDVSFIGDLKIVGADVTQATLKSLRSIIKRSDGTPAQTGDSLFWSELDNAWYADHPDSEINHNEISGLDDDDHAQYLNVNGRAGGQLAIGGTNAADSLTLASTSHVNKGLILFRDVLAPETDGTNIGTSSRQIGDSYHKGQAIGLRAENTTTVTLPSPSAAKAGRIVYDSTAKTLLVDDGGQWRRAGAEKVVIVDDTSWDGFITSKTYNIGTQLQDATKAIWEFVVTSTGEKLYPKITKTANQVIVTFKAALPATSYTLIGVA